MKQFIYPESPTGYVLSQKPRFFGIVVPEETTNLVDNPSFEYGTEGFTAMDAVISQSTEMQKFGSFCLKVVPSSPGGGTYTSVSLTSGSRYTFSLYVFGHASFSIFFSSGSTVTGDPISFRGKGKWERIAVSYTAESSAVYRVCLISDNVSAFYTDAWQCEGKGYPTTFCDEFQDDCFLSGSTRSRRLGGNGGRVVDLQEEFGFGVLQHTGLGVPSVENFASDLGITDGSFFQNARIGRRAFQIVGVVNGASLSEVERKRKSLIASIPSKKIITIIYAPDDDTQLFIRAVYDGGLEGDVQSLYESRVALRFIAYDPFLYAEGNSAESLTISLSLASTRRAFQRGMYGEEMGVWKCLGPPNNIVYCMLSADDGLYAGGAFTSPNYFGKWNPSTSAWEALGSGISGAGIVLAAVSDPSGNIYVGGYGITGRVQKWNGSAWTTITLTDSASTYVYALAVGNDGKVYAGGDFHGNIAGVPVTTNMAVWDGASWTAVAGVNDTVRALAVGFDGSIYAGGYFTSPGGAGGHVAKWDGSTWTDLNDGLTGGNVYALAFKPDGKLVAGGSFTGYCSEWNGVVWRTLGSLNDDVLCLDVGSDGMLYAGGAFTTADSLVLPFRMAQWNGYSWFPLDGNFPSSSMLSIVVDKGDVLSFGYGGSSATSVCAGVTPVTTVGNASAFPIIRINGPGSIHEIINWTNGSKMFFFNVTLLAGESLTIDLRPGKKTVLSNFRGNMIGKILPGSNLATWRLDPGENTVALYMQQTTAASLATIEWRETYVGV